MTSRSDSERMLAAAVAELRAGRLVDAERIARSVCDLAPNEARAFHLAGVLAHQLKRNDAAALLNRAVAIDPPLVACLVEAYTRHAHFEEEQFLPLAQTILGRDANHLAAVGLGLHMRRLPDFPAFI